MKQYTKLLIPPSTMNTPWHWLTCYTLPWKTNKHPEIIKVMCYMSIITVVHNEVMIVHVSDEERDAM